MSRMLCIYRDSSRHTISLWEREKTQKTKRQEAGTPCGLDTCGTADAGHDQRLSCSASPTNSGVSTAGRTCSPFRQLHQDLKPSD